MRDEHAASRVRRGVVVLLCLAGALHVGLFVFGLASPRASLQFDRAAHRLQVAQQLAACRDLAAVDAVLSQNAPPGDYAWHALVLTLTAGWVPALQIAQLLLFGLACVALFRMVAYLEPRRRLCWLAVALYAVIPIDFMVPHFVASEAFYNPLLVFGSFYMVRYARASASALDLGRAGVLYSLSAVTRPEIVPWLPVLIGLGAWIVKLCAPGMAWRHIAVLVLATSSCPGAWLSYSAHSGLPAGLGRGELSVGAEIARRVETIEIAAQHAGGSPAGGSSSAGGSSGESSQMPPLQGLRHVVWAHPAQFTREWAWHTLKLLLLPDNLDFFRYLGAFEMTGKRAQLVHEAGLLGTLRLLYAEMPVLVMLLLTTMGLFVVFWILVGAGIVAALRRTATVHRLVYVLLLSLPVVYVALRALSQGESRKRSPLDFVLVVFAALGCEAWLERRERSRSLRDVPASGRTAR